MNFSRYIVLALKGCAMGMADVVPGVSGGTIAFISGIYEELLDSIRSVNATALKLLLKLRLGEFWRHINGSFLLPVLLGIAIAIFSLARLMTYLLTYHPIAIWSFFFGLIIGMISATKRNKWQDHAGMALAVSGISFPTFALGLLLMEIFSVSLGWLPTVGADSWKHYISPSITLGAGVAAVMARFTRASFVEILQDDYIRTARAKGLSEWAVIVKHGLRNALIPVVTMMGLQFGFLLGGSIVVEKVFNWPGLGRLLVDAVEMRDYPVLQAEVLLFSLEFILINLLVDILYAVINPRICFK